MQLLVKAHHKSVSKSTSKVMRLGKIQLLEDGSSFILQNNSAIGALLFEGNQLAPNVLPPTPYGPYYLKGISQSIEL